MFRKLLAISVIAAIPAASFAGGPTVSGYTDITYSNNNDTSVFLANAELNISNSLSDQVTVRVDTDFAIAGNDGVNAGLSGPKDSAAIEQAYFAYTPMKPITIIAGVFNNPIGWEKEDAPDMYQINKGQIYGILDYQTALYGNNIAGAAVAGAVGPATITIAALNDIGHNDLEKNSFAAIVNVTPMKGLDFEVGFVSQQDNTAAEGSSVSAGNVWDVNATYSGMGLTVGLETLGAEEVIDLAWGGTINYEINPMFNVTARYDSVSYKGILDGKDNSTSYAIAGAFNAAKNLTVLVEYTKYDSSLLDVDGAPTLANTGEDKVVTLEFIASF